ncbi:MAG: ATP phosphoribosyltransferase [Hyphomicrobiaceae bacterium]|nr:ATP phosphoribosyltransferase [Hyphomicrobiaceae bacterium]MCC0022987.1 ATP phosphoribosyltransferase [Hyphomicrobiaceae bacterium]
MSELVLAVPSKGRLEEQARAVFEKAGLMITRPGGARAYQGELRGLDGVTVRFLSAGEIARELTRGNLHVGVTGADLIHEVSEAAPNQVIFAKPLGFGEADVVIAVPDAWRDVTHMDDLSDVGADFGAHKTRWLRVATKYVNLTRAFFSRHGIAEYRIVESLGATEAAPANGSADLIVDITTTGNTLKANGLRVLEDGLILKSQANLIVSRKAAWSPAARQSMNALLQAFGVAHFDLTA